MNQPIKSFSDITQAISNEQRNLNALFNYYSGDPDLRSKIIEARHALVRAKSIIKDIAVDIEIEELRKGL